MAYFPQFRTKQNLRETRSRPVLSLSSLRQGYPKREIFRKQNTADVHCGDAALVSTSLKNALVNDALDGDGGGFAAADAERGDAALQVLCLQRMQQRYDQAGAGGADRMAERAGAPVDVGFF